MYPSQDLPDAACDRGGPGRGLIRYAAGMVKQSHQDPIKNKTSRREKRSPPIAWRMKTDRICTMTAARYPMPIPYEQTFVDSCISGEGSARDAGKGRVRPSIGRSAAVESINAESAGLSWSSD